jgi:hypothetical protein
MVVDEIACIDLKVTPVEILLSMKMTAKAQKKRIIWLILSIINNKSYSSHRLNYSVMAIRLSNSGSDSCTVNPPYSSCRLKSPTAICSAA